MTKLSSNAADKTNESLEKRLEPIVNNLVVSTQPMVVCGVQRKANIGNFENIDVYIAVALPVALAEGGTDLNAMLREKIDEACKIASEETYDRYKLIKNNVSE
jgi:hypothetical protein